MGFCCPGAPRHGWVSSSFSVTLGGSSDEMLRLAASVQGSSEHPLARAFVTAAEARGLTLSSVVGFRAEVGRGVVGRVGGRELAIGNARMMAERGVDLRLFDTEARRLAAEAKTVVAVVRDGEALGLVALADTIRPESAEALLLAMRKHPLGAQAVRIGTVTEDPHHFVQMNTRFGGRRVVDWLSGEQLPRIC